MRQLHRWGFVWIVVTVLAVACGGEMSNSSPQDTTAPPTAAPTVSSPPSGPEDDVTATSARRPLPVADDWTVRSLGAVYPDGDVTMVEHDGRLWVAHPGGEAGPVIVSIVDGDTISDHQLDIDQPMSRLRVASTPIGVVVAASTFPGSEPHVWVSSDGERWTHSIVSDQGFDPLGITSTEGRVFMSGTKRVGDTQFQAGLFHSSDGMTWTEVVLDDGVLPPHRWLGPIIVDGDRLVATGERTVGDRSETTMLESLDSGVTWRLVAVGGPVPMLLAPIGGQLFGTGAYDSAGETEYPVVVNRSGTWEPVDIQSITGAVARSSGSLLGQDDELAVIAISYERPTEYCYENPNDCSRLGSVTTLLRPDGTVAALDLGMSLANADTVVIGTDGSFHVLLATERGLELRTWASNSGPVPTMAPSTVVEPTGPPLVDWEATLDVGGIYRFPLYTHCGIDVLGRFNGLNWWLSATVAADFRGNGGLVYGEIHVVAEDRIEYVVEGRTVAEYAPRDEEFPACM